MESLIHTAPPPLQVQRPLVMPALSLFLQNSVRRCLVLQNSSLQPYLYRFQTEHSNKVPVSRCKKHLRGHDDNDGLAIPSIESSSEIEQPVCIQQPTETDESSESMVARVANIATATPSVLDATKRVASAVFALECTDDAVASLAGPEYLCATKRHQDTTKMQTESVVDLSWFLRNMSVL